ncbi:MAG: hypothetical protein GX442_15855 [Candidatus Riflebacteria bacterium]|nr:hypothetical protein [Candidatus Riflebacteria bacterium]
MKERTCHERLDFQAYVDQQLSGPEQTAVERHVRECPACARELERTRLFFTDLQVACAVGRGDLPTPAEIDGVMARLARSHPVPDSAATATAPWAAWMTGWGFEGWRAATVGAALGLLLLMVWAVRSPGPLPRPATPPAVSTPAPADLFAFTLSAPPSQALGVVGKPGAKMATRGHLQSGTVYQLPSVGKLYVTFKGENRLELSKQARFEVAGTRVRLHTGDVWCRLQRTGRDIVVETPTGTVTPLGTRFYVEATPRATRVTLEEGQVILRTRTTTVSLKRPGTLFMLTDGTITTEFETRDVAVQIPNSHLPDPRTLERPPQADSLQDGY